MRLPKKLGLSALDEQLHEDMLAGKISQQTYNRLSKKLWERYKQIQLERFGFPVTIWDSPSYKPNRGY